jgi:hypothetical protein
MVMQRWPPVSTWTSTPIGAKYPAPVHLGSTNRRSPRTNILCGLHFKGHFKEVVNGVFQTYDQADGPAIHIHGASTNIYVHNVEAYKKKYGLQDKDDDFDNCDSSINYPNGVQKGHVIVYNWFHYTESQGMYIGNTAPNNQYTHSRKELFWRNRLWRARKDW